MYNEEELKLIYIRLSHDINLIIKQIVNTIRNVEVIYLCGSYGRDEGAWSFNGNVAEPYNDYDIVVFSEYYPDCNVLKYLRTQLAEAIGIHWVDIDVYNRQYLKKMHITVKNIDLMFASKIIYKKEGVVIPIKKLNYKKIRFFDIETLYFTRMWTFFGVLPKGFENLEGEDAKFFRNQMAKASLAIANVLLIKKHKYKSSYINSVSEIKVIFPNEKNLHQLLDWAISEKISPNSEAMNLDDVKKLYNNVYNNYYYYMKKAFSWHWIFYCNPDIYYLYKTLSPYYAAKYLYALIFLKIRLQKKGIKIREAMNALFLAYNSKKSTVYLHKNKTILNELGYKCELLNWDYLRKITAIARNEI